VDSFSMVRDTLRVRLRDLRGGYDLKAKI